MDYKLLNLTPIEEYNNILFKRDDKYIPFSDIPINGGKVRQALSLILENLENIKTKFNGTVATATSVHSPQGIIISRIAKEFGLKSIIGIGNHSNLETVCKNHSTIRKSREMGSEIKILSKFGFNSVLYRKLKDLQKINNFYIIMFGMGAHASRTAIIDSIANQVQNLPKDLDNLVIPVGSGIIMAGILTGLIKYKIYPKRIIGIQIANTDRRKTINDLLPFMFHVNYDFILYNELPYSKFLVMKMNDNEYLDPIYEAKAFSWMLKNIDYKKEKTLFWIVGNSKGVR